MNESTITSDSTNYLDLGENTVSYVAPHIITYDFYSTLVGSKVLELQSSISQFINASTVDNPSTSDESFVSSSSTSSSTTNYLETISISRLDVDASTISDLLPDGSSATKTFLTFHPSSSSDSNTKPELSHPQTQVSNRTTAFETATVSTTTLLFNNENDGTSTISTAQETTRSVGTETNLSTTDERTSFSTLATTIDSVSKSKSPITVSTISQWNTETQTTAFQRTEFTTNNPVTELPSKSDSFDGQRLAAALGTLAVILVLAVVIILLALWWR